MGKSSVANGAVRHLHLKSGYSLGDLAVLSGAIRDLHRAYPGHFRTSIETALPDLWRHHPLITPFMPGSEIIDCSPVMVDRRGERKIHYIEACLELLNERIGTQARLTEIRGDLHLSNEEKNWYSDVWTLCGREIPYWIICPGGKFDIPIKWWDHRRCQEVVDYFRGKIQFVQAGWWGNHHPALDGVIDLRGRTQIRDLLHLMYTADGVLCGVTSLMHLAAAVPLQRGRRREAVIIGGAREPASWEAYPRHEFISTEEQVECAHCWRNRVRPLPDGRNQRALECPAVQNDLPRCMDLITSRDVIERFEKLEREDRLRMLPRRFYSFAAKAREAAARKNRYERDNVTMLNAAAKAEEFIRGIRPYPAGRFAGRGIVLCSGGVKYFTNAWVCIRMLRQHGCGLPVEVWHLGRKEMDRRMEALLAPLGVRCVNARQMMNRHPMRNPLGWELKSYALLHTRFREILFLDSDNVAVRNPEPLFETPEYLRTGAIFWPDYRRLGRRRPIWKFCGVPYRDEPEFESGQMVIDKERCWRALNLAFWYNDHSEFFYQHVHGDKETFHMAWRKLDLPYAMPTRPIHPLEGTMCQHDFSGRILFQHRNLRKWQFFGENPRIAGFQFEEDCLRHLEELRRAWNGRIRGRLETVQKYGFHSRPDTSDHAIFTNVALQNEYALPKRLPAGGTVIDVGAHIGSFSALASGLGSRRVLAFEPDACNYEMARLNLAKSPGVKARRAAVLDRRSRVKCQAYPADREEQNTGGGEVFECGAEEAGGVEAIPLDDVLRKEGRVLLIKLDCEGSEWPILLHSNELGRAKTICGEYHEREVHPLCPEIAGRLDRALLRQALKRHFKHVRTQPDPRHRGLGKFWASHELFPAGQEV